MALNSEKFLVAFDMDGTMLQDEWAHAASYKSMLNRLGLGESGLTNVPGASLRTQWKAVVKQTGVSIDVEQTVCAQFGETLALIRKHRQPAAEGLEDALNALKKAGCTIAVTSSSDGWFVREVAAYLKIEAYIDFYVTGDMVKRLKPEPDIYLRALYAAGVSNRQAAGVEDSPTGCEALRRADIFCIGFDNDGRNPLDLSRADTRIPSMRKLPELIEACRYGSCPV